MAVYTRMPKKQITIRDLHRRWTERVIERTELSERDSLRVLALLENPPKPTAKLRAAAKRHRQLFGR